MRIVMGRKRSEQLKQRIERMDAQRNALKKWDDVASALQVIESGKQSVEPKRSSVKMCGNIRIGKDGLSIRNRKRVEQKELSQLRKVLDSTVFQADPLGSVAGLLHQRRVSH